MALEEKFNQNKEDLKQVQDVMLRTKTDIAQQVSDLRAEMSRQSTRNENLEGNMDRTIADAKFWMEKYTKAYKENDAKIGELQGEFNGRIETIFFQLGRRVTVDDMKKNFDKLNDMLFIKFQQVESNKQALRDMLNYQKYFYPLQMQAIIGENMMQLDSAMKDQAYMQYQQKRYDTMLADLQKNVENAKGENDKEMQAHLDLLDKKDLKTTGWQTTPLENVDHDFVSPLLDNYLKDLDKRIGAQAKQDTTFAQKLRKTVTLFDSEDLINLQYQKVASLKELADQKEH